MALTLSRAALAGGLIAGVGFLALARLWTGPWYSVYSPAGSQLMEGWPIAWEALYYSNHLPTFLGDGKAPVGGISPVQYRTLLNLYLASLATGWTGSGYAGLALVDVAMWCAASIATLFAFSRLGAARPAAAAGAFLVATSPLLVSNMWRHDLHVANFATMALGLWAALVLIDEQRETVRLTGALGALFLFLSLSYQYQWVLLPVSVVFLRTRARLPWSRVVMVAVGATALLLIGTALIRAALDLVGLTSVGPESTAVQEPERLLLQRLEEMAASSTGWLPGTRHLFSMAAVYHPVVLAVSVCGLVRAKRAAAVAALGATFATLLAISLYPAPWTTMSAYPLIYLGGGVACYEAGRALALLAPSRRVRAWIAPLATAAAALSLASLTNGDLWGDYRFLQGWWRLYVSQAIF